MSKALSITGFWRLPGSRKILVQQLVSNQILRNAWRNFKPEDITVNAPSTLAHPIELQTQIYERVASANPKAAGASLKIKQWYAYGKVIMTFYKHGVVNVWNNNKEMKHLKNQYKVAGKVNSKGQLVDLKIAKFDSLVLDMAQAIYMKGIESQAASQYAQNHTTVVKKKEQIQVDEELFSLSRKQFQLLKRTPTDIRKLLFFGVILAIFMEMTPTLCYLIPEITPLTCVLPYFMPKLWNSLSVSKLHTLVKQELETGQLHLTIASRTSYNIPIEQAHSLAKSLRLLSRYIPVSWYPESVVRDRLQSHYNYLTVDDYYLAGLNDGGNLWDLSVEELLLACLERGLVSDLKLVLDTRDQDLLRALLFRYLVDAKNYNIGLLTVVGELPSVDKKALAELRAAEADAV